MSTIDLRELAKSLMFAEKAKEEVEELRRDNERLYEITVEHAKLFEKDQQTILDLKQTILNLEFKVKQLEEGTKNLTGALISKGEKVKEMEIRSLHQEEVNQELSHQNKKLIDELNSKNKLDRPWTTISESYKDLEKNCIEALNRVASLERIYKEETESIRKCFATHDIQLYPSVDNLINAFENLNRLYESLPILPDSSMSQANEDIYHLLTIQAKIPSDVVRATNMLGKMEMLSEYIHKLQDEREYHQYRYEKIREIILPVLMDDENETK